MPPGRKLLRGPLGKHLAALGPEAGVSFEATVTLEYGVPLPPPSAGPSLPEDDWVAAVDGGEA